MSSFLMIESLDCIIWKTEGYYRILRERAIWSDMHSNYVTLRNTEDGFESIRAYGGNVDALGSGNRIGSNSAKTW